MQEHIPTIQLQQNVNQLTNLTQAIERLVHPDVFYSADGDLIKESGVI